jgi:hypothetical protein
MAFCFLCMMHNNERDRWIAASRDTRAPYHTDATGGAQIASVTPLPGEDTGCDQIKRALRGTGPATVR